MTITNERIYEVANQLSEKGVKPTLSAVRQELGSGSFSTISNAMRSWRDIQATDNDVKDIVIPESLDEKSKLLISSIWKEAIQLANDKLNEDRKILQETRERLEEEASESEEAVKILEVEAEKNIADMAFLENKLVESDIENKDLVEKINQLNQIVAVLQASKENLTNQLNKSEEREVEMRKILQNNTHIKHKNFV